LVPNQPQRGGFPRRSCEQVLDKMRPVLTSAPVRNGPVPPTPQRFEGDKEAGDTVAQLDAVVALDLTRSGGPRFPPLCAELRGGFLPADNRALWVRRLLIHLPHIFPVINKHSGLRRREAPPLP